MGVKTVWVFDPETRRVFVSSPAGVEEHLGGQLTLEETAITIDPAVAFARLDRRR